jgi:plasmid stabilization system protein ParE
VKLIVRSEARQDVADAADWYDRQLSGLGDRFVGEYIDALTRIESAPLSFGMLETVPGVPNLHRCQIHKFPYVVVFRVLPAEVLVVAVIHTSRDEGFWLIRLSE